MRHSKRILGTMLGCLLLLLCSAFVSTSIVLNTPTAYQVFDQTSVMFNFTPTTTGAVTVIPAYLYLSEYGNDSNMVLNQTIKYATNGSAYNFSVLGFIPSDYKFYIVVGDGATKPVMSSSNSYPFNTGDGNNTMNFNYTVNGTFEQCTVTLSNSSVLNASDVVTNFGSSGCNFTATNTSIIILTGTGYGSDEYIQLDSGNASTKIGFSGIDFGTQTNYPSVSRWFQIENTSDPVTSNFVWGNGTFDAMILNKDNGDLTIMGWLVAQNFSFSNVSDSTLPAACPDGTAITHLQSAAATCTSYIDVVRFNSTEYWSGGNQGLTKDLRILDSVGTCYLNITDGLITSTNCTEI